MNHALLGDLDEANANPARATRSRWLYTGAVLAAAAAVIGLSGAVARWSNVESAPLRVEGVVLGLAPRDVRERFTVPGQWKADPSGDDYALDWTASDPSAPARSARFEFHAGSLVAIRARVSPRDDAASGGRLEVRSSVLLARSPAPDGDVDVLLVARDCPTHAAEVGELLRRR